MTLTAAPPLAREMKRYEDEDFGFRARDLADADRRDPRLDADTTGVLVDGVTNGSWASLGRMSAGDVILAVDGRNVTNVEDLAARLKEIRATRPVVGRGVRTPRRQVTVSGAAAHVAVTSHEGHKRVSLEEDKEPQRLCGGVMGRRLTVALTTTFLCLASQAHAQTPEERAARARADREARQRRGVRARNDETPHQPGRQGSADSRSADSVAGHHHRRLRSRCDVAYRARSERPSDGAAVARARRGQRVSVTTEPAELRYRLADGKEVPVRVVLRDKDLDLAFLRPVDKPATPLAAIDSAPARPQPIDAVVVLQRLPETGVVAANGTVLFSAGGAREAADVLSADWRRLWARRSSTHEAGSSASSCA